MFTNTDMKNNTSFILVTGISTAVLVMGCNQKHKDSASLQIDQAQEKTAAATQDMKDFAFEKKAEFIKNMHLQLAELNRDLDQFAVRIEKSSAAVKAEAQPKLDALRDQAAVLKKQLDKAQDATESSWDTVKDDFKESYKASKDGFQQARRWLSEKIAP